MIPGPPPVMTATPLSATFEPKERAALYDFAFLDVRAEPNTEIAGPSSARAPNPSTNSDWIRRTRHGSSWSHDVGPSFSRSWDDTVFFGIIGPRMMTGPLRYVSSYGLSMGSMASMAFLSVSDMFALFPF